MNSTQIPRSIPLSHNVSPLFSLFYFIFLANRTWSDGETAAASADTAAAAAAINFLSVGCVCLWNSFFFVFRSSFLCFVCCEIRHHTPSKRRRKKKCCERRSIHTTHSTIPIWLWMFFLLCCATDTLIRKFASGHLGKCVLISHTEHRHIHTLAHTHGSPSARCGVLVCAAVIPCVRRTQDKPRDATSAYTDVNLTCACQKLRSFFSSSFVETQKPNCGDANGPRLMAIRYEINNGEPWAQRNHNAPPTNGSFESFASTKTEICLFFSISFVFWIMHSFYGRTYPHALACRWQFPCDSSASDSLQHFALAQTF